jgi:hypothetical protein
VEETRKKMNSTVLWVVIVLATLLVVLRFTAARRNKRGDAP